MNFKLLLLLSVSVLVFYQCKSKGSRSSTLQTRPDFSLFGLFKNFEMTKSLQEKALTQIEALSNKADKTVTRGINGRSLEYDKESQSFRVKRSRENFVTTEMSPFNYYLEALASHWNQETLQSLSPYERAGLFQVKTQLLGKLEEKASTMSSEFSSKARNKARGRAFQLKKEGSNDFLFLKHIKSDNNLHLEFKKLKDEGSLFTFYFDSQGYHTCLAYLDHEEGVLSFLDFGKSKVTLESNCTKEIAMDFIFKSEDSFQIYRKVDERTASYLVEDGTELKILKSAFNDFDKNKIIQFIFSFLN